jgi:hypothetical protein
MAQTQSTWDRFEISILRLCRGQYLALAVLGMAAVVLGGGAALVGLVMGMPSRGSLPPEVPGQQPLALSDVEQLRATRPELFNLTKATSLSLEADLSKSQLDSAKTIKDLFPEPPYAWDDVIQEYCRSPSGYGCLEKGRRIAKPGTARLIASLLSDIPRVNATNLLNGVRPALSNAKVEQRAELFLPSGVAYMDAVRKHDAAVEAREKKVADLNAKYDAEADERRTFKTALIGGGLYGVASGISAMLLSGLFLAFLAVERHLRDIRERRSGV